MANALISSAPLVAGITDPDSRANLVGNAIYPVARLLIGNDFADKLNLPKIGMPKMQVALLQFRLNNALGRLPERVIGRGGSSLVTTFGASLYDNAGVGYACPTKRTPSNPPNRSRPRPRGSPRALGLFLVCRAPPRSTTPS